MKPSIIFLSLAFVISCNRVVHLPNEDAGWRMISVLSLYTEVYASEPKSIDDLLVFIERCNTNTFDMYGLPYQYLKRYKKRWLLDVTDTTIAIYDKTIAPERLVALSPNNSRNAYTEARVLVRLFDKKGLYIISDTLEHELLDGLESLARRHWDKLYCNGRYNLTLVQLANGKLYDMIARVPLDTTFSEYYRDVANLLETTRTNNNLSRIIISCYAECDNRINSSLE